MMTLEAAIEGMLDAQEKLRQPVAKTSPSIISEQYYRLAQFTSAVEYHLGKLEEDYERDEAKTLKKYMIDEGKSATAAEKFVKMEMGDREGKIKFLTRITSAAWRQHMGAMGRVNNLSNEMKGSV